MMKGAEMSVVFKLPSKIWLHNPTLPTYSLRILTTNAAIAKLAACFLPLREQKGIKGISSCSKIPSLSAYYFQIIAL